MDSLELRVLLCLVFSVLQCRDFSIKDLILKCIYIFLFLFVCFFKDTVVALQALALYSEKTAGNALDLRVKLTSEVDADWKPPEIHFTPENALLRREFNVRNRDYDGVMTFKRF